jgi:hypothetical protein
VEYCKGHVADVALLTLHHLHVDAKRVRIRPRTREAVSAFVVQMGFRTVSTSSVAMVSTGLARKGAGVGLQHRFPLSLVFLIPETSAKRFPHVISHLAKRGNAQRQWWVENNSSNVISMLSTQCPLFMSCHSRATTSIWSFRETGARKWVLRFTWCGRAKEMGLGAAASVPLADAREKAASARRKITQGLNPIDERKRDGGGIAMTAPIGAAMYLRASTGRQADTDRSIV